MEFGLFGLIVFILDVYALVQIFTSSASTVKKIVWALVVLILPLIGLIIWFLAGPRGASAKI